MKPIDEMTDDEVLEAAQGMGPGIIGQELYDRAQKVAQKNPEGSIGPAILAAGPLVTGGLTKAERRAIRRGEREAAAAFVEEADEEPADVEHAPDDFDDDKPFAHPAPAGVVQGSGASGAVVAKKPKTAKKKAAPKKKAKA